MCRMGNGNDSVARLLSGISGATPLIHRSKRIAAVAAMYHRANLPHFCNPLWLAVGAGFEVRAIAPNESPPTHLHPYCIYYLWGPDEPSVSERVYRALASRLVARQDHNDLDVYLMAAELAMPELVVRNMTIGEVATLQPFAPLWWIEARISGLRASGVVRRASTLTG